MLPCWPSCRYPSIYLFKFYNMRNEKFKELRDELKENSRCVSASVGQVEAYVCDFVDEPTLGFWNACCQVSTNGRTHVA